MEQKTKRTPQETESYQRMQQLGVDLSWLDKPTDNPPYTPSTKPHQMVMVWSGFDSFRGIPAYGHYRICKRCHCASLANVGYEWGEPFLEQLPKDTQLIGSQKWPKDCAMFEGRNINEG